MCVMGIFYFLSTKLILNEMNVIINLSALQTKTDNYASSMDPDETSYLDKHCLPFCFYFLFH